MQAFVSFVSSWQNAPQRTLEKSENMSMKKEPPAVNATFSQSRRPSIASILQRRVTQHMQTAEILSPDAVPETRTALTKRCDPLADASILLSDPGVPVVSDAQISVLRARGVEAGASEMTVGCNLHRFAAVTVCKQPHRIGAAAKLHSSSLR